MIIKHKGFLYSCYITGIIVKGLAKINLTPYWIYKVDWWFMHQAIRYRDERCKTLKGERHNRGGDVNAT